MIDIVNRLRFDAIRCEATFSKGVAGNIAEGADEIERLRAAFLRFVQHDNGCMAQADGKACSSPKGKCACALEMQSYIDEASPLPPAERGARDA